MAESSWPSPSNGRVVDDSQYEKIGISLGPPGGVVGDFTSPQLIYGDSSGRQIKVAADRYALVRGHAWWSGSSILTVSIGANTSGSTRTDLVVLRLSRTTWDVTLTVIAGTPGAGAPSPTQNLSTTGNWDLPLATVTVANNASTITAGNVTYVAPHLDSNRSYRSPAVAALAYIPQATAGLRVALADGSTYQYSGSAWGPDPADYIAYTPTFYSNATAGTTIAGGSVSVTYSRYQVSGKRVHYYGHAFINTTTSNAFALSLPVNVSQRLFSLSSITLHGSAGYATTSFGDGVCPNTTGPFNRVTPVSPTNSFLNILASGDTVHWNIVYESI